MTQLTYSRSGSRWTLRKLVGARWFPTISRPIVAGALTSGLTIALHSFGVVHIPHDLSPVASALAGLLVTAIATDKGRSSAVKGHIEATVTTHVASYKPEPTLGQTIAGEFLKGLADEIDSDPSLLQNLGAQALQQVLNPAQAASVAPSGTPAVLPQT